MLGDELNKISESAKQTALVEVRNYATNVYIPFLRNKMYEAARIGKKSLRVFVYTEIVDQQPPDYDPIQKLMSAFPETEKVIVDIVRQHFDSPTLLTSWHHRGTPNVPYHELGLSFNWDPEHLSHVRRI